MESNSLADSEAISENDKLYLDEISIPSDILFPDELNQYLQGQLQFMQHSNDMLSRKLQENELELKEKNDLLTKLNFKVTEYERFTNPPEGIVIGNPSFLMSAKIIELSKKLKDKTVQNQTLKTKFSRMQHKLSTFEQQSGGPNLVDIDLEEKDNKDKASTLILSEEMKCLQDRLSQTTNRLFEIRNKNIELKNELKTAHKILQQELGDSFTNMQSITSQTSWRGRAQQIINLQQKNTELQEKVMSLSSKDILSPQVPKADKRKLIIEQQEKELNNNKVEIDDLRKKWNGARARNRVLETECANMKSKMNATISKTDNDERMINLLKTQISSLEEATNENKKEKQFTVKKLEEENKGLIIEKDKLQLIINNLKKNLEEKSTEMTALNKEIEYFKQNGGDTAKMPVSFFNKDCSRIKVLEVEVNRLLELVAVLNTRLDEERNSHAYTQMNYKKERQRAARIEVKLSRIELENSMNLNQNHSYTKSLSRVNMRQSEDGLHTSTNLTIEKLKNSLELAEETVAMLKNKLSLLQREKELDFQRFSSILSETSSMLLKMNSGGQFQMPFAI